MVKEFGEPELFDVISNLQGQHDYVKYNINENSIEIYKTIEKKQKKKTEKKKDS
jgi:hypothetical protein